MLPQKNKKIVAIPPQTKVILARNMTLYIPTSELFGLKEIK